MIYSNNRECIDLNLPPVETIVIRNEVDRFGFSYFLAKNLGFKTPPRSYACFQHGWVWRKDLRVDDLGYYFTPRSTPIVVATAHQANFLRKSGFSVVREGGLPFAYIPKSNNSRKNRSLLIMPPHSVRHYGVASNFYNDLIGYIKSIEKDYSQVYVCLHRDDALDMEIVTKLKENDVYYIVGASADDAHSLYRMRCIFDYFEFVTTIVMGSHILYAAFSGCKVSILDKYFFYYPEIAVEQATVLNDVPGYKQRSLNLYNNKEKLREQFPWLFVQSPLEAVNMISWANDEIGLSNLLSKDQLIELLGWSWYAKVKSIRRIVLRRIAELFK